MDIQKINQINANIAELREKMSKGITAERKLEIQDELHKLGRDILKASL